MDTYFSDKVAVVTGAGGIICSQVSKDLAELGITVLSEENFLKMLA